MYWKTYTIACFYHSSISIIWNKKHQLVKFVQLMVISLFIYEQFLHWFMVERLSPFTFRDSVTKWHSLFEFCRKHLIWVFVFHVKSFSPHWAISQLHLIWHASWQLFSPWHIGCDEGVCHCITHTTLAQATQKSAKGQLLQGIRK